MLRSDLRAPFAIRIADGAPLTVVVVVRGETVVHLDGDQPRRLTAGEVAVVRGPTAYLVADTATTAPQALIGPGQTCARPDGSPLTEFRDLGLLAWGNAPPGGEPDTVLLTGTYEEVHEVGRRVLDRLPPLLVIDADHTADHDDARAGRRRAVVDLLLAETTADGVGQDAVVDRLVDLVLVTTLRAWFDDARRRPFWFETADPVVGAALRRIHHEPRRAWRASPTTSASPARPWPAGSATRWPSRRWAT